MKRSFKIVNLLLVCLLIFSSGVRASIMQNLPQHPPSPDAVQMMDMETMPGHCHSQPENSSESPCQNGHCSMCIIGLTPKTFVAMTPVSPPMLPTVACYTTSVSVSELFRPPQFVL